MQVKQHEDPHAFRAAVEDYLLRDEARHNLMLGLIAGLTAPDPVYAECRLWTVEDAGDLVGVALQTPPHNVLVAGPAAEGVVEQLAETLAAEPELVPGVGAALPEADVFAEAWQRVTGIGVRGRMAQALHVLRSVEDVPQPSGSARTAGPDDLDLVVAWYGAFSKEAVPDHPYDERKARRGLSRKLAGVGGHGVWLWEDPEPVCLVGSINATESTARIAPVYTPPELRRKGYATALTAHASMELLQSGKQACMLYTDLANPTSNAIYAKVGYEVVCDAAMVLFERG